MAWRLIDHTADIQIEGRGTDPASALIAVVEGFSAQLTSDGPQHTAEMRIAYEGVDAEDAIIGFLGEILYLAQVKRWVPASAAGLDFAGSSISATLVGGVLPPKAQLAEIKAVTYHDFYFGQHQGQWTIRVVFDV